MGAAKVPARLYRRYRSFIFSVLPAIIYSMVLAPTKINVESSKQVTITWNDDRVSVYPVEYLRSKCPCASCREVREDTNPLKILPEGMTFDVAISVKNAKLMGRYALNIEFSDDHSTGIFSFTYLREIDPAN